MSDTFKARLRFIDEVHCLPNAGGESLVITPDTVVDETWPSADLASRLKLAGVEFQPWLGSIMSFGHVVLEFSPPSPVEV